MGIGGGFDRPTAGHADDSGDALLEKHQFIDDVTDALEPSLFRLSPDVVRAIGDKEQVERELEKAATELHLNGEDAGVLREAAEYLEHIFAQNIPYFEEKFKNKGGLGAALEKARALGDGIKDIEEDHRRQENEKVIDEKPKLARKFEKALEPHVRLCEALDELCQAALGQSLEESGMLHGFTEDAVDAMHARGLTEEQIAHVETIFDRAEPLINDGFIHSTRKNPYTQPDMEEFLEWTKEQKSAGIFSSAYTNVTQQAELVIPGIKARVAENDAAEINPQQREEYVQDVLFELEGPLFELFPEVFWQAKDGEVKDRAKTMQTALKELALQPDEKKTVAEGLNRWLALLEQPEKVTVGIKNMGDRNRMWRENGRLASALEDVVYAHDMRHAVAEEDAMELEGKGRVARARAWLESRIRNRK